MDAIMEFIFSNFIIILIIVGAITKLLGGNNEEEQQKKKTTQRPSSRGSVPTKPRGQSSQTSRGTASRPTQTVSNDAPSTTVNQPVSVEEEQERQLKRLAGQMDAAKKESFEELSEQIDHQNLERYGKELLQEVRRSSRHKNKTKMEQQFKNKMTKKGLAESIVMAEILGPPRAKKPYESIITTRKQLK